MGKHLLQLVMTLLLGGSCLVGAATETNQVLDAAKQQIHAQQWLGSNTVVAGRSRGGDVVRRALLVGINTYEPTAEEKQKLAIAPKLPKSKKAGRSNFQDLDGCVNDAEEMRALLIARFGFKPAEILMLTNWQATRAAILSGINQHLVETSRPDDVAFFFYAGHGSQVVNSKSDEPDRRDETIVPADSWSGVPDIRDKELRSLFNAVLDRGSLLTVIFDSCHSGSTARGQPVERKTRHAEPILDDIADPTQYGPSPEERGALVLSAAQDDQLAEEQNSGNVPHGAFTAELLRVLRLSPIGRTATDIFLSVNAGLKAAGHMQMPVLSGTEIRRRMGLFGGNNDLSGGVTAAVLAVSPDGEVTLQGGWAAGLNAGCQLRKNITDTNAPGVTLEVTRVDGLISARAKVIAGSATNIHVGDVFQVSRWMIPPEAMLRVWLPPEKLTPEIAKSAVRLAEELRKSAAVDWTDDPTQTTPTHLLVWDGGRWRLLSNNTELARFDEKVGAAQLLKAISNPAGRPKIFMSLPPSAEIKAALNLGRSSKNNAIELVARPEDANYVLVGTVRDGAVRCAWVLPNAAADANTSPLPVRTFWFPTNGQPDGSATVVARQLEDAALRIGKIKAWLKLESPDDAGRFPYKLAFKNTATGKLMSSEEIKIETSNETGRQQVRTVLPVMKGGEEYSAVLHADPEALKQGVEPRLIYVLTMDSSGHGQLAWPRPGQGNSQSFPPPPANGVSYPTDIPLTTLKVGPPYGVDSYVMLTTRTAIPDESVFTFDGVRGGSRGGDDSNPLQRLLNSVGSSTRGAILEAPADWSIQKVFVQSVPGGTPSKKQ